MAEPHGVANPRRRNMQANRRRDTTPELLIRRLLHADGLRYRCDLRLSAAGRSVRPDIVFTRSRVAVFVDGCFWHQCPEHGSRPSTNREYWNPKFDRNADRDRSNTEALEADGWEVIRAWEHEIPADVAGRVGKLVRARGLAPGRR
jgi:DNA mismatch endonuclease, patch repair protein